MSQLLSSAEGVSVTEPKSYKDIDELQKACLLRDKIRKERIKRNI
jgi:hypothetical protein